MPSWPYFSAFCFASFKMSSATWRSRSSSFTVGPSVVPICARTRLETTEEREDMMVHTVTMLRQPQAKGSDDLCIFGFWWQTHTVTYDRPSFVRINPPPP